MTLSAWGLLSALLGAVLLALTTRGFVRDGGGWQGNATCLGFRFRRWPRAEEFVDLWGPRAGWLLVIAGFALQLAGAVRGG